MAGITRMDGESWEQYARRVAWLNTTIEIGTEQKPTIATAWGEWLSVFPWDAWGTMTFAAGEFTHEAASRAWARFARHVSTQAPIATWFVGHEVGARGRLHLHCLLGQLTGDGAYRSKLWEWWFTRYGRAQIDGYDPAKGAAHYVAKYVTKELAHYDLDFGGWTLCDRTMRQQRPGGGSWLRKRGGKG